MSTLVLPESLLSLEMMGNTKAAVLPVPVCALPITSVPSSNSGMARNWMGEGSVQPIALTPSRTGFERPSLLNGIKARD